MTTYRAYSFIEVKEINEGLRIIEGIASTPTPDRMNDIVEPLGASFKTPMPLLWQHDSRQPVGHVISAKATKDGISFKAKILKVEEAGTLKNRLDEAWQSVKTGLVRAVSIGFASKSREYMDNGGIKFTAWEWLELSLVTIPANAEATITSVKSIDTRLRAALGPSQSKTAPGAPGQPSSHTKGHHPMSTFKKKIDALEAEINPKRARMTSIYEAAQADGERKMTPEEAEEFDTLKGEVKEAEVDLERLKALDISAATARPVTTPSDPTGARAIARTVPAEPRKHEEKGLSFGKLVIALCYSQKHGGGMREAMEVVKSRYAGDPMQGQMQTVLKAAIAGATTDDPSWAAPLVGDPNNLVNEFVDYLRPQTIIGKFGTNGIPGFDPVPFNIRVPVQTSGGTGYWVGEGKAKPLTRADFTSITMRFSKVANIAVITEELLRHSTVNAELRVRNMLAGALIEQLDIDLLKPSITEIADTRPAALTNGAQTYVSSGNDADAVRFDLARMLMFLDNNNIPLSSVVIVMRSAQAIKLSFMRNALGNKEFPDMTPTGGFLEGFPVIASNYKTAGQVTMLAASEVFLADDGGVAIDMSREASLEMLNDSAAQAVSDFASPPQPVQSSTNMVSMFQTNSVALRAERVITWKRKRTAAVVYQTGTAWGQPVTSPPAAVV